MEFAIETELEVDGRWIAEITQIPGLLVYGASQQEAVAKVQTLALRVRAERSRAGKAFQRSKNPLMAGRMSSRASSMT